MQSRVPHDVRHVIAARPFAADMQRTLRRIPNLLRFSTRTSRMIRTIAALVVLSAMTAVANAADTGTAPHQATLRQPGHRQRHCLGSPAPGKHRLQRPLSGTGRRHRRGHALTGPRPEGRARDGPGRQATQRTARLRQTGRSGSRAPAPRLPVTNNAAHAPTRPIRAGQRPYAFAPPSIVNPVPLIDRPSGPTTNATSAATSSALPYC